MLEQPWPPGKPWNWLTWWNACFLIAGCFSAVLGTALVDQRALWTTAAAGMIGLGGGAALVLLYGHRWPRVVCPLVAGILVALICLPGQGLRAAGASIPVVLVATTYSWFRRATVSDVRIMPRPAAALGRLVGDGRERAWNAVAVLLGTTAAEVLRGRGGQSTGAP